MNKIRHLRDHDTTEATTYGRVASQDHDPRAGRGVREDFALPSIHLDDALALSSQLDTCAFLFCIDVEVTPLRPVNGRPSLHEQHRTPLFKTPPPRRMDGKRNRLRPAHDERSAIGKLILSGGTSDNPLTRHQQNNALRMLTWLFGRIDNKSGDVRVICKGVEVSTWEPMTTSTGTMMIALHPLGMTGSIFDRTARKEMGIAKQQDLRASINVLKQFGAIIDTEVLEAKRRVWQAAPKLAGGNIHVRSALNQHFTDEARAARAVADLQRELHRIDAHVPDGIRIDNSTAKNRRTAR